MKDGKPCRVCVDFKTWARLGKRKDSSKENNSAAETQTAAKSNAKPTVPAAEIVGTDEWKRQNCPADVKTLGRHTWTLLHTMAAYYPEKPDNEQQQSMKTFFETFTEHYPCWFCKKDFKKEMAENPIDVTSRDALSEWLCKRHNKINEKLGKKQFDCSKVFERWLTGPADGSCDK
ncbi:FAD-linked sulfhydryl oxidase ALR-like protein [Mycotypha africana]|uniref:FAD-linked sulfhydryl oxidase ALR-like protein n=1 Tax=Mycotypha africana TaxID=64632 RepID=UPI002300C9CE|nr:FAD-linked sulfhydryl oxidase ALR-like protein [Mycotypha africana]KAI8988178.1 FAD-linked sulfhydryl oxidase ALR-like protein [Mycotypha africana]